MRLGSRIVKIILKVLLIVACAPLAFAQEADTTVPPDLAAARAHYQAALDDAKRRYLQELEKLKADAVVENNSELIDAVAKEFTAMGGTDTTLAAAASGLDGTEAPTIEGLKERLTNMTWVWYKWETITFLRDGMAKWSGDGSNSFTWSVVSVSPPTIAGKSGDGRAYKMVLDANLRTGEIFQDKAPERTTARVKRQ